MPTRPAHQIINTATPISSSGWPSARPLGAVLGARSRDCRSSRRAPLSGAHSGALRRQQHGVGKKSDLYSQSVGSHKASPRPAAAQASGNSGAPLSGPYALTAAPLAGIGLVPIPCGGADGKQPLLINWTKQTAAKVLSQLPDLIARFGHENIGIACGASNIVVIDIDDVALVEAMLARFGDTPVIVESPSGGLHLYYRANATIRSRNLRASEGLAVDIKATGGFVVVPPSINPASGNSYQFLRGGWDQLQNLPPCPVDCLPNRASEVGRRDGRPRSHRGRIPVGTRNDWLFTELLKQAPFCDDYEALLDVARTHNDFHFEAPLPDTEVTDVAQRVWRYEIEGRNWSGKSPRTILSREELHVFARHKNGGDALLLWAELAGQHARRKTAFAVDREAMARANVLPGWSGWRYRQAIEALRELDLLVLMEGGERRPDKTFKPYLYLLRRPEAESRQHVTQTASLRDGAVDDSSSHGGDEPQEAP